MSNQRSLRGSTHMNRRATDSALSEAAERRAMRDVSESSSAHINFNAPPAIKRISSAAMSSSPAISPIKDANLLLKACLTAPTRNPSSSPPKNQLVKSHKPSPKIQGISAAFSSRIERVVRKAYRDVKAARSSEREKLVRSVLDESLDRVVVNSFAERSSKYTKQRFAHDDRGTLVDNYYSPGSHGHEKNQSSEAHKVKEKKEHLNWKRKSRHNGENGFISPKKRKHKRSENGDSSPSPKKSKSPSCNGAYVSPANGLKKNGIMANGYGSAAKQATTSIAEAAVKSPFQKMVFPRLPSSSCNIPSFFEAPFCKSISANEELKESSTASNSKPYNLASNNNQNDYAVTVNLFNPISQTENRTIYQPLLLEGTHAPRPSSSSVISLKSFFTADDERNLAHVPYFGEENNDDFDWDLFDVEERMKLYEYGPPYCEKETTETIDEVLKLLAEREPSWFQISLDELAFDEEDGKKISSDIQTIKHVHSIIAELSDISVKRVHERHVVCFGQTKKKASKSKTEKQQLVGSPLRTYKKNSAKEDPACYDEAIDSYRDLFCRICFTYDCQIHGNVPKANLRLLGELAITKEHEGHWKELDQDIDDEIVSNKLINHQGQDQKQPSPRLSKVKKAICERAFFIFQGNTEKIAEAINTTTDSVDAVISERKLELQPPKYVSAVDTCKKRKGKEHYQSMKNYNPKWLANIQGCVIHPAFLPCDHDEPCNEKTCSCVQNKFFCNKACGWGWKSKNYFRGCACKAGQCRSSSCPCWAANRECDPDLCQTCGACTDPPQQLANKQRCRNDNISMRRHAHLLLAKSSINAAGWGLFTKHALQKGNFVHEYVGEVISQEEAERRGIIYDKLNMSYLFNLSSDFTVDATRKGNKLRYANHSSSAPNCEAKMIRVNGDMRIGLFAKVDIDAQSELFFDYRYDETIDNELIIKPAHKFHWMKSPARKDDPKKTPTNNIPMKAAKKHAY